MTEHRDVAIRRVLRVRMLDPRRFSFQYNPSRLPGPLKCRSAKVDVPANLRRRVASRGLAPRSRAPEAARCVAPLSGPATRLAVTAITATVP